jgi:hypothetical protein
MNGYTAAGQPLTGARQARRAINDGAVVVYVGLKNRKHFARLWPVPQSGNAQAGFLRAMLPLRLITLGMLWAMSGQASNLRSTRGAVPASPCPVRGRHWIGQERRPERAHGQPVRLPRRLYEACGDIPPAELENAYYRQNTALAEAGQTTN